MRGIGRALLSFFWIGRFPVAPGTVASAVAALVYCAILAAFGGAVAAAAGLAVAVVFTVVTVAFGGRAEAAEGRDDPGWIVSDEVAGQMIALLGAACPLGVVFAFLGFRVFDIAKPFPIGRLEKLPAGWGIVADDLAAGAIALALLHLAGFLAPGLNLVH